MDALMARERTGFAACLRRLREQAGLTQAELARRAGLNVFAITKLEQGQREPQWQSVIALAKALGCRPDDFLAEGELEGAVPPAPPAGRPGRPRRPDAPAEDLPPPPLPRGKHK